MTINGNRPELDGYYVLRDKMNDRRHWDSSHPEYESYNAEIRKGFEALYGENEADRTAQANSCPMRDPNRVCREKPKCNLGKLGMGARWNCYVRNLARDREGVVHRCNEAERRWEETSLPITDKDDYADPCSRLCCGENMMVPRCCNKRR